MILLITADAMAISKAPKIASQVLAIDSASLAESVITSIAPFITNIDKPKDKIVIGKVKIFVKVPMVALTNPKISAIPA
jgi:hypothetical protein